MENRKNIDDLFREQLGDYTETPPPAAWGAFEKKLKAAPSGSGGTTRRRIVYAAITGILLLLLTFSVTRNMPGLSHAGDNTAAVNAASPSGNGSNSQNGTTSTAASQAPAQASSNSSAGNTVAVTNNITAVNSGIAVNTPTGGANAQATGGNNSNHNNNAASINSIAKHSKPIASRTTQHNATAAKGHNTGRTATGQKGHIHSSFSSRTFGAAKEAMALENEHMPENAYNGTLSKPATGNNTAASAATENESANDAPEPATAKPTTDSAKNKNKDKLPAPGNKPKQPKAHIDRWEAGVKIGYERGFNNDAGRKLVTGPYVQYNLNEKFAILAQPSFKVAQADTRRIGNAKGYYKANNDSTITPNDDKTPIHIYGGGTLYVQHFTYAQSHDSIVKTNSVGGSYYELELPLLLKYKITKGFSAYGGPNIVYSKLTAVKEHTNRTNIMRSAQDTAVWSSDAQPNLPAVASVFTYSGTPYSAYTGPEYAGTSGSEFRFGYMLGFSADLGKRWLVDGLLQQTQTSANYKAAYNVNTALTAPYFRFTIGYKLTR